MTDQPDFPITRWVEERDSIMKLPNGPEKDAALVKLRAPRNGVPFFAQRVFAGRDRTKAAVVSLGDRQGKPRLRLMVDSLGHASVDFLDADGRVTLSLPDALRDRR